MSTDPRRRIPSVDRLLGSDVFAPLLERVPRALLVDVLQGVQAELRAELAAGADAPADIEGADWYARRTERALAARGRPSLRRVINATGVVLHTNLGRAPLAAVARAAIEAASSSYSNLEYDLDEGGRGSRYDHCALLLRELTGAEDALVVNNNAAAVVLALNTLARGRDAVISRGELVEIGGAFRVPEIMERSGARMVEVGSTNRTHLADYDTAIGPDTGVVLRVHRSNFQLSGFVAEASPADLVALARARGVPVLHDLGSGLLFDLSDLGLPGEPTAGDALRDGADVVTMSGDKLLGGPQAGILLGRAELLDRMRRNPLCRALRVDKLTLAALEATLALYRDPLRARREVPVLRMLAATAEEIGLRAAALASSLEGSGSTCAMRPGSSAVGGGSFPAAELPTTLLTLEAAGVGANELERRLRAGEPAVVARIVDGRVAVDLRTVAPGEEPELAAALRAAAEDGAA